MNEKRKRELKKALKNGHRVMLGKWIAQSSHFETPVIVTKIHGNNITTENGNVFEISELDDIYIVKKTQ